MDNDTGAWGNDDPYREKAGLPMTEIITTYQEEQEISQPEPQPAKLGTSRGYSSSRGVLVQIDGESTTNYYLCNPEGNYSSGTRVLLQYVGGTYVVVCAVGFP